MNPDDALSVSIWSSNGPRLFLVSSTRIVVILLNALRELVTQCLRQLSHVRKLFGLNTPELRNFYSLRRHLNGGSKYRLT
jgi:hypothetical protein